MSTDGLRISATNRLSSIGVDRWNALAQPASTPSDLPDSLSQETEINPFISYDFLDCLEATGCVGGATGWEPVHVIVEDETGQLRAAAPTYVKHHSQGEYVFDHGWAEAYARAGGRYYPKLQVAVPFTPVPGPRLLVRPPGDVAARARLVAGLLGLTRQIDASSLHITFCSEGEARALMSQGFLHRTGQQFHWLNAGYRSYDDFLATLASRKRKALKRERREATDSGLTIRRLTGADIRPAHWDAFFACYMDTGARKWGRPYLNRAFFEELGARMADRILLVMAFDGARPVAAALNLIGSHAVFGRNWGALEPHPFLHFELCYHQAIDFAIDRGLARVEAGAQGEHKLARGYMPVTTHSAHFLADPRLARAVAHYLEHERAEIAEINAELAAAGPYRRAAPDEEA